MNQSPSISNVLVVGIGASAGGIGALREFFEHVAADSGVAYVAILHLSPDYDSQLAQILQTVAPIPVTQVTERVRVEPDHVYVIPPNQHLLMIDGDIAVSPNTSVEERRAPVDIFFRTLAESHDGRSVAVVLSGTGANGSMGLKRVKERGGAVFVQNPHEAEYGEMPRNAIATGLVDDVLPVAALPARIAAYRAKLGTIDVPMEAEQRVEDQQGALREIFTQLRLRTGHDFSNYKRATLLRRIERRISLRNLSSLSEYAASLRNNPDETQALLKDLLISVTNFFRDRKAFNVVENDILPRILSDKTAGDQVRVWVVGCATGEEAYSLAMLLADRIGGMLDTPKVQIFATDIDEAALAHAREGLYTLNDAADVSPEQLRHFFTKEGDSYRIQREIREMVLFANHNIIKDSPFSHLDLVSCRNVLIYLNHTAQERVMETLHFALNPGGFLFLGTSETPDGASDLYTVIDREQHIFQSRQTGMRIYPMPEVVPTLRPEPPRVLLVSNAQESRVLDRMTYGDLHQRLLEQYAPPSVVVNEEYDIVHLSERAGRYLHIAGGEPSNNLLKLIRPELRLELRTALYQAVQRQTNVDTSQVALRVDDHVEITTIRVRPVLRADDTARGFLLVLFEQHAPLSSDAETVFRSDEPLTRQLEEELLRLKAQLRASGEHHEFQAEELKASNEELQAINEELRSTAEELETSKEELQSINEELRTVNQELKIRIDETTQASNNLQNLVNSTNIGTIFLDRSLRVALFTPAAGDLFNLIPADHNRPLSNITNRLANVDVIADAEAVLHNLQPIEREVQTSDDKRMFLMRVQPYRTAEDRINGVVLTFVDISERKRAEAVVRESQQRLQLALDASQMGTFLYHIPEDRGEPDARMLALFGLPPDGTLNLAEALAKLIHPDDRARYAEDVARSTDPAGDGMLHSDIRVLQPDGGVRWVAVTAQVMFEGESRRATMMYGMAADISERKRSEQAVRESEAKYRTLFMSIDEAYALCDIILNEQGKPVDYRLLDVNPAFEQMTGITPAAAEGATARELVPGIEEWWIEAYGKVALGGETYRFENRVEVMDRWFDAYASPVGEPGSGRFALVFKDITERKRAEARQAFLLQLSDALRSLSDAVDIQATVTRIAMNFFGADRCYYCEIIGGNAIISRDAAREDLPSVAGVYPLDSFAILKAVVDAGRPFVVQDVHTTDTVDEELRRLCIEMHVISYVNVPIVKNGKPVGVLCLVQSTPRAWTDLEVELARETAERTWAAVERARAEEALAESEEKYRTLFNSMDEGVVTLELIFDENERAIDFVYLEHNPALTQQTGLTNEIIGKRVSTIFPDLEAYWFESYERVAKTGDAARFEYYFVTLDSWFDIYISRVGGAGSRTIVAIYNNITERKRREAHQALLVEIGDDISRLVTPDEIMHAVGSRLGEYLNLGVCVFVDVYEERGNVTVHHGWNQEGVPSLKQTFRFVDYVTGEFARASRAGEITVVRDTGNDARLDADAYARLNIGATFAVPFHREGRWTAFVSVTNTAPRDWRDDEIELVRTIADRVFPRIERARAEEALAKSEEKYRTLFDSIDEGFAIVEVFPDERGCVTDVVYREANAAFERHSGMRDFIGKRVSDILPNLEQYWLDMLTHIYQTGEPARMENYIAELGRWLNAYYSRVGGAGSRQIAVVFDDITERKRHEANLAFLAEVSQDLAGWTSIENTMNLLGEKIGAYFKLARCVFVEIIESEDKTVIIRDWRLPELSGLPSEFPLSQFVSEEFRRKCRAGEILVVPDVYQSSLVDGRLVEEAFGVTSFVNVPLLRNGQWRFTVGIYDIATRDWRADEIELVRELTTRIWTRLERARAEEALRESEGRLQRMVNMPRVGVLTFDFAGTLLSANDAFLAMVDYSRDEFAAQRFTWQAFTPQEHVEVSQHQMELIRTTGVGGPYEKEYFRKDGSRVWMMFVAADLGDGTLVEYAIDISDRKRAEAALREANERFRTMSDNAQVLIWETDASGIIFVNQYYLDFFGVSFEDVVRMGWAEFLHPDDTAGYIAAYQEAFERRESFTYECRFRRADGEYRWIFSTGRPLNHDRFVGFSADITDNKRAEEALRESEERLRLATEAAQMYSWEFDIASGTYRFSANAPAILGVAPNALPHTVEDTFAIVHPDDRALVEHALQHALDTGEGFALDIRSIKQTGEHAGETVWLSTQTTVIRDAEDKPVRVIAIAQDTSDRKRAEEAVYTSEARFRTLTDAVPQVIWTNEAGGKANYFNQRWYAYSGLSYEQSVGLGWQAIVHPDDAPASVERWQQALAVGTVFDTEYRLRRADGVYRWFIGRNVPLRDDENRVIGWFGSATDIHDLKEAEAALQHVNEELETRVQDRTTTLADTNAELQAEISERMLIESQRATLLQRIITAQEDERQRIARELHDSLGQFLSALNLRLALAQQGENIPTHLHDELAWLRKLANQIDDEVDRLTTELRPPTLSDTGLIDALASYTHEWTATSGIPIDTITLNLDTVRLPSVVEVTVYRIVQEALNNVLKHAQATQVSLVLERRSEALYVLIEDNGKGFDLSDRTNEGAGGRQIGLMSMTERANLAGGELTIESAPGVGTTVYLHIPLVNEETTDADD